MKPNEVNEVLREYLKHKNTNYAILIDGEWGSGKTYYINDFFKEYTKNNQLMKFSYISLYGKDSLEKVSREILYSFFGYKHRKKAQFVDSIFNLGASLFSGSLGNLNIDLTKLYNLLSKIDINNWTVCIDDLERSSIPINDVLGFINSLVEHNNCKVIILANEREIGNIAFNDNLEGKYAVALSGKEIALSEVNEKRGKNAPSNKTDNFITINELKECTQKIFGENIIYQTIREKVIGFTIRFEPELNNIYSSILSIKNYHSDYNIYLQNMKGFIINELTRASCSNIRTLKLIFDFMETIYNKVKEQPSVEDKFVNPILKWFLKYLIHFNIKYRNGINKFIRENNSVVFAYYTTEGFLPETIKGFMFIDIYCTTLNFDQNLFSKTVKILVEELNESEKNNYKHRTGESYNIIQQWNLYEDQEVKNALSDLLVELKNNEYNPYSYFSLLYYLLWIKDEGFIVDIDNYFNIMKNNLSDNSISFDYFNDLSSRFKFEKNKKLQEKYEQYMSEMSDISGNHSYVKSSSVLTSILLQNNWAQDFYDECNLNKNEYIVKCGFMCFIDLDILISKMKTASPMDIYIIENAFKKIYGFSNIRDFFLVDRDALTHLKAEIQLLESSDSSITRRKALHCFNATLVNIVNNLQGELTNVT